MTSISPNPRARLARWWPLGAALLIVFVMWPVGSLTPTHGIDPSWRIALHMAVARGIDFGDIAFTYGPLGFLHVPLNAEAHTLIPALVWTAALLVGMTYLIIECARRTPLGWPGAVILALVTCRLLDEGSEVLPVVAFLWAALVVQWGVPARVGRVLLPVSGVLCGLGVLVKFNEGLVALVLAGAAAWWLEPRRWRALAVFAGSALAAGVVAWVAMGNDIGGLARWTRASLRVASGYSAGQPFEELERGWQYPLFIVVVAAIAWFAWQGGEGPSRARRICISVLGAFFVFTLFKHGFVRRDLGHAPSTFTSLIAVAAAVRWRRSGRLDAVAACAVAVAGALATHGVYTTQAVSSFLDPAPRIENASDHLRLALSPGHRAELRAEARAELRAHHYVPTGIIDALRGHTVHVDPYEVSIAWAYGLDWDPPPLFQAYLTFTNELDRSNASALLSKGAPERILRYGGPRIDLHSPEGEAPEALLAMLCGFRQEVAFPGWQVLRPSRWRCGPERPLASVEARAGQRIPIPPAPSPDDMVMARLHIPVSPWERLRTALYKPRALPEVILKGEHGFRIPVSVAQGPLLLRAPADLGWSDYGGGFQFDSLRVVTVASPFRVNFVAVHVTP